MNVRVNRQGPRSRPPRSLGVVKGAGGISLVQAARRRRQAERAFEDHVRAMARRWDVAAVPPNDGPGAGDVLPRV
jgi:hypothetical protein